MYWCLPLRIQSDGGSQKFKSKSGGGMPVKGEGPWDRITKADSADVFNLQMPPALTGGLRQAWPGVTKSNGRYLLCQECGRSSKCCKDCGHSTLTTRWEVWGHKICREALCSSVSGTKHTAARFGEKLLRLLVSWRSWGCRDSMESNRLV